MLLSDISISEIKNEIKMAFRKAIALMATSICAALQKVFSQREIWLKKITRIKEGKKIV